MILSCTDNTGLVGVDDANNDTNIDGSKGGGDIEGDGGGVLQDSVYKEDSTSPSGEGLGEGGKEARISSSSFSIHSSTRERSARLIRSTASMT